MMEARIAERVAVFLAGDPASATYIDEVTKVRKDGSIVWIEAATTFLRNDRGWITIVGVSRDITARKQAEEALQEKHNEMERFTYTVSHDLRSPLITVKTFLGYLEQDVARSDAGAIRKDMQYVHSAADKMGQLLDELLELSRVGRITNPPVEVIFQELAQEAINLVAGAISERGVEVQIGDVQITLRGDRPRLVEVWQNLIENAVKFIGDQERPVIEIGAESQREETVFFIRDNGMGIDPLYHEKAFGLFEKLNPDIEGTGLGLAVVRRIISLYGGKVWIESKGVGYGTKVLFTVPQAVSYTTDADRKETTHE